MARDNAVVLVAETSDRIVGVGMMNLHGEILLNYVHPQVRFSGVSTALLAALEGEARAQGVRSCFLESTKTAHKFYVRSGYLPWAGDASRFCKAL